METLITDAEGKVTIPSEVLHKRGLRPGDAVALVESAEGLLVTREASILRPWRGGMMALNGSGIRDTARVLKISPTTVLNELKKSSTLSSVNRLLLALLNPDEVTVVIRLAEEAEVDEMWSCVGKKQVPRWLGHAIDHRSGHILAYVFGCRKDAVLLKRKALLEPFGITRYYTDSWGASTCHLDADEH